MIVALRLVLFLMSGFLVVSIATVLVMGVSRINLGELVVLALRNPVFDISSIHRGEAIPPVVD
jgi:hypothetical protein